MYELLVNISKVNNIFLLKGIVGKNNLFINIK